MGKSYLADNVTLNI